MNSTLLHRSCFETNHLPQLFEQARGVRHIASHELVQKSKWWNHSNAPPFLLCNFIISNFTSLVNINWYVITFYIGKRMFISAGRCASIVPCGGNKNWKRVSPLAIVEGPAQLVFAGAKSDILLRNAIYLPMGKCDICQTGCHAI